MKAFPFIIDGCIIMFGDIDHDVYYDDHSTGINFYNQSGKYNIHCNISAGHWCRLIINFNNGEMKDLPFHEGTWHFLPEQVKIERTG